jgi:hypothetical protein
MFIDVLTLAGVLVGEGPITTATGWTSKRSKSRGGTFSFSVPLADSRAAALVQPMREVRCYDVVNGEITLIGNGIIGNVRDTIDNGRRMRDVSGDDMSRDLMNVIVGNLEIGTSSVPVNTGVQDIEAFFPGTWSLSPATPTTGKDINHKYAGETVLAALGRLAELVGEDFYIDTLTKTVHWFGALYSNASTMLISPDVPNSVTDVNTAIITSITKNVSGYDGYIGRLYMVGSGTGAAIISLNGASQTPPVGYTLGSTSKGYYLQHDDTWTTYSIERFQSAKDVKSADELYEQAYETLRKNLSSRDTYTVGVAHLTEAIQCSNTIYVSMHGWTSDGVEYLDMEDDYYILDITEIITPDGIRLHTLTLGADNTYPATGVGSLISQLGEAHRAYTHAQSVDVSVTDAARGAGTLSVATANDDTITNHTHAITSSSNPGSSAAILASNANGALTLTALTLTSNLYRNISAAVTASTTQTQAGGTALTRDLVFVTTCANDNDTVVLPTASAARQLFIFNTTAHIVRVFPASGDDLGAGVDTMTANPIQPGKHYMYTAKDSTNWAETILN